MRALRVGSRTLWGTAQSARERAPGIYEVSTAGHGGIKLDRAHNAKVHPAWRRKGGWYEEDCDWAIVAVTFPEAFPDPEHLTHAHSCAKNWSPDEYAAVFHVTVDPADSCVLRDRNFRLANVDNFVVRAAWGDWEPSVPEGFVGVFCHRERDGAERSFLVPKAEYTGGYFVADLTRHQDWTAPGRTKRVAFEYRLPASHLTKVEQEVA